MYATKLHVYVHLFESKCLPSHICPGECRTTRGNTVAIIVVVFGFRCRQCRGPDPSGSCANRGRSKVIWRSVAEKSGSGCSQMHVFVSNNITCGLDAQRVQSAFSQPACRCSQMNEICERRHACGADADWNHHAPSPTAGRVLTNECHL